MGMLWVATSAESNHFCNFEKLRDTLQRSEMYLTLTA